MVGLKPSLRLRNIGYIIILLIICGCYTPKKAERKLNKVEQRYPELLAKKASELFPGKMVTDSFYLVKWRDSIVKVIDLQLDTINSIDTVTTDCNLYRTKIKKLLTQLKQGYKEAPVKTITITDSSKNYLYQSQINQLEANVNKYRGKYESWLKVTICTLGLLIISLVVHIARSYTK